MPPSLAPDDVDRPPVRISCPGLPEFPPPDAYWAHAEFRVTATGAVADARPWTPPSATQVPKSAEDLERDRRANEAVADMVMNCRFEPALKDGVPVDVFPVRISWPLRRNGDAMSDRPYAEDQSGGTLGA